MFAECDDDETEEPARKRQRNGRHDEEEDVYKRQALSQSVSQSRESGSDK